MDSPKESQFPDEMLIDVLDKLQAPSHELNFVSKQFNDVMNDPIIWSKFGFSCQKNYFNLAQKKPHLLSHLISNIGHSPNVLFVCGSFFDSSPTYIPKSLIYHFGSHIDLFSRGCVLHIEKELPANTYLNRYINSFIFCKDERALYHIDGGYGDPGQIQRRVIIENIDKFLEKLALLKPHFENSYILNPIQFNEMITSNGGYPLPICPFDISKKLRVLSNERSVKIGLSVITLDDFSELEKKDLDSFQIIVRIGGSYDGKFEKNSQIPEIIEKKKIVIYLNDWMDSLIVCGNQQLIKNADELDINGFESHQYVSNLTLGSSIRVLYNILYEVEKLADEALELIKLNDKESFENCATPR